MSASHGGVRGRTSGFVRNAELENLLTDINSSLWNAEQDVLENIKEAEFPLVLLIGPHRSGTTLLMQWLANTGLVAYPTNLLSRFYQAPIIGAQIQLLLTDPRFNFRDELGEFVQQADYRSENGKTKGVLAPNEFWYFWRRFLAEPDRDVWTDAELKESMDTRTMLAELAGMMHVFQKPFAAKAMLFNYNIPFLDSVFNKVLFVHIKRDPVTNVASVLDARRRQMGSEAAWYSFKIPEYEGLRDLDAITQCAGHVHYINQAVEAGMETVAEQRKLIVQYEDFCADPESTFIRLYEKLGLAEQKYSGPSSFAVSRSDSGSNLEEIRQALRKFRG